MSGPPILTPPPGPPEQPGPGPRSDLRPRGSGPVEVAARTIWRTVFIVLAVLGILYLIVRLRTPLTWIVIATFIAVALSGPVNVMSRRMPRGLAILLAYLGLILIPAGVMAIVIPPLVREGTNFANDVPEYVSDLQRWVNDNERLKDLDREYNIVDRLRERAEELPQHLDDAASTLQNVGGTIVSSLFAAFNILILSIFMVASGRRWVDHAIGFARPEHAARIRRAVDRISTAVGNYVGGALLQATIAGITTFIVLSILGVPFAAPLAVLMGVLDLIPLVGATIGAILVGLVTVFHDFPVATIVWVIWAIAYQQIENTMIQPQIQRRAVEVHAFVVLVSVLFGGTLFGILGALLAIPVAASIQIALREWWDYRQASVVELPPGVDMPEPPSEHEPAKLDLPPPPAPSS